MSIRRDPIVVLHVDDEPDMCDLVSDYFEQQLDGFSVVSATSGERALDRLDDSVDCIVSDYEMPGMTGLDLLRNVRVDHPNLPFVLLTGMGSETVASDAISAGVTDYFRKSASLDGLTMLAQRIETAVAARRATVSYRELFEKAAEGFALHDPETGAFIDANASALRILDYDRATLLGMRLDDIETVPPQDERGSTLAASARRATEEGTIALEEYCRRADGTGFWLKIQFKSIEVSGRTFTLSQLRDVTERKRYEETLSALHTSMAELVGADRPRAVVDCVVATVEDILDADYAAVYLHDAAENRLELVESAGPSAADEATAQVADAAISLHPNSPVAQVFIDGVTRETTAAQVFGSSRDHGGESGRTLLMPLGDHGVLVIGNDATGPFAADEREFMEILANAAAAAIERIRTGDELHSSRAEMRSRTDEMERLTRTNSTLRELSTTLLRADSREEVYTAICENLRELSQIKLTWVGVPADDGAVDRSVWAGTAPQYLDSAPLDGGSAEPAVVAARTGTAVHVENTALDLQREPWRRTALSHGIESVSAVPIEVDGVVVAVLSVLASDPLADDAQYREMLSAIATSAGETIHAVEQRHALETQPPTELLFELDGDSPLQRLAAAADCQLDVRGVVSDGRNRYRVFLDTDADAARVRAAGGEMAVVHQVTVLATDSGSGGGTLELELAVHPLDVDIAGYAVDVVRLNATSTSVEVTLTVARSADVRDIAALVTERYPDATLRSKRRRAEPADVRDRERLDAFSDALTPRQREVLQVAYLEGYFDSPRGCTGDELGDKLGISSQAVYQHLREAQRKLLDETFNNLVDISRDE